MAKVAVLLKVLPEDVEIDLDALLEKIRSNLPSGYEIVQHKREPIAFGLESLRLVVFMPEDTEGGTSELEKAIASVEGVGQVDVLMVSRISE